MTKTLSRKFSSRIRNARASAKLRARLILEVLEDREVLDATWVSIGPAPVINSGSLGMPNQNDPRAGAIEAIAPMPGNANILFIATVNGGIWKTTNALASAPTWTPLTDNEPSLALGDLKFDPTNSQILWAGTGNYSNGGRGGGVSAGVMKSIDGGLDWQTLNPNGIFNGRNIRDILPTRLLDPTTNKQIVLAGTSAAVDPQNAENTANVNADGLYRSPDGGTTWVRLSGNGTSGLPNGEVTDLVLNPNSATTGNFFAGILGSTVAARGIYAATSGTSGLTWLRVDLSNPTLAAAVQAAGNIRLSFSNVSNGTTVLYALLCDNTGANPELWWTNNGGTTWQEMDQPGDASRNPAPPSGTTASIIPPGDEEGGQGLINLVVVADPSNPNLVYAAGTANPDNAANGGSTDTARLFVGNQSAADGTQWVSLGPKYVPGFTIDTAGSMPAADARFMTFDANGGLIEADDGGIYRLVTTTAATLMGTLASGNTTITGLSSVSQLKVGMQVVGTQANSDLPPLATITAIDNQDNSITVSIAASGSDTENLAFRNSVWTSAIGNLAISEIYSIAYDSNNHIAQVGLQDNGSAVQSAQGNLNWPTLQGGDGNTQAIESGSLNSILYSMANNFNSGFTRTPVINGVRQTSGPGAGISAASNTAPIVITSETNGLANGDMVYITGVVDATKNPTPANGVWTVDNVTADTFDLVGSDGTTGNPGVEGGSWIKIQGISSIVGNGGSNVTVTTAQPHGLATGAVVTIKNSSFAAANGVWTILVTGPSTFQLQGDTATGNANNGFWYVINDVAMRDPTQGLTAAPLSGLFAADRNLTDFDVIPYVINAVDPTRLLMGYNGLYESFDRGETLPNTRSPAQLGNSLVRALVYGGFLPNPANPSQPTPLPNLAYVGQANGSVLLFTSVAGGTAFTNLGTPFGANSSISALAVDPTNAQRLYIVGRDANGNTRIAQAIVNLSTQTATFTDITAQLIGTGTKQLANVLTVTVLNPTGVAGQEKVVVGGLGGVFLANRVQGAQTIWTRVGAGLPNVAVMSLAYNKTDDVLVAGTFGRSAWTLSKFSSAIAQPVTAGAFDPTSAVWYLRSSNSSGPANAGTFSYGAPGWTPVTGDWNGDSAITIGVVDPSSLTWYLRNENSSGAPDAGNFQFGGTHWIAITGDWNGDGTTTIGAVDPTTMTWYMRNENSSGAPDAGVFQFGASGWIPVVGDWNGSGHAGIGAFDPKTGTWYLRNEVGSGSPDAGQFQYGGAGWTPLAGDWTGQGKATVGVVDPSRNWYLRNSNSSGAPDIPVFQYGGQGWGVIVGNWKAPPLPQLAAGVPSRGSSSGPPLTSAELKFELNGALDRLLAAGMAPALIFRLENLSFTVGQLPAGYLAESNLQTGSVEFSSNAAGFGWFVDSTPERDEEFAAGVALPGSSAAGHMDLLTVILHEMGHFAGWTELDPQSHPDALMALTLGTGTRRTQDLDAVFETTSTGSSE